MAHTNLTELREVGGMHERKAMMAELADAFIALPGGFGTFDELFEIVTWAQIGIHSKPIGLLDVRAYFTPLLALIAHSIEEGFVHAAHAEFFLRESDPVALLDRLQLCSAGSRTEMDHAPPSLTSCRIVRRGSR